MVQGGDGKWRTIVEDGLFNGKMANQRGPSVSYALSRYRHLTQWALIRSDLRTRRVRRTGLEIYGEPPIIGGMAGHRRALAPTIFAHSACGPDEARAAGRGRGGGGIAR